MSALVFTKLFLPYTHIHTRYVTPGYCSVHKSWLPSTSICAVDAIEDVFWTSVGHVHYGLVVQTNNAVCTLLSLSKEFFLCHSDSWLWCVMSQRGNTLSQRRTLHNRIMNQNRTKKFLWLQAQFLVGSHFMCYLCQQFSVVYLQLCRQRSFSRGVMPIYSN